MFVRYALVPQVLLLLYQVYTWLYDIMCTFGHIICTCCTIHCCNDKSKNAKTYRKNSETNTKKQEKNENENKNGKRKTKNKNKSTDQTGENNLLGKSVYHTYHTTHRSGEKRYPHIISYVHTSQNRERFAWTSNRRVIDDARGPMCRTRYDN